MGIKELFNKNNQAPSRVGKDWITRHKELNPGIYGGGGGVRKLGDIIKSNYGSIEEFKKNFQRITDTAVKPPFKPLNTQTQPVDQASIKKPS